MTYRGSAQGVTVVGNHAYVADDYSLRVINVANPAAPVEVGFCDNPRRLGRGRGGEPRLRCQLPCIAGD